MVPRWARSVGNREGLHSRRLEKRTPRAGWGSWGSENNPGGSFPEARRKRVSTLYPRTITTMASNTHGPRACDFGFGTSRMIRFVRPAASNWPPASPIAWSRVPSVCSFIKQRCTTPRAEHVGGLGGISNSTWLLYGLTHNT